MSNVVISDIISYCSEQLSQLNKLTIQQNMVNPHVTSQGSVEGPILIQRWHVRTLESMGETTRMSST